MKPHLASSSERCRNTHQLFKKREKENPYRGRGRRRRLQTEGR
jgi:hypothetical protein